MKKRIIFCVDDEKIVLNGLKAELKNSFGENFIIETAENAMEALSTIEDLMASGYEIPVIISDYAMPNMKGDELLTKVHEISPRTLKILLTGQATIEGVTNSINNAGLFRYIAKPWETYDLILSVEQAIRSYDQENKLEFQNKALRELSASLEEKVIERTRELQSVNSLLLEKQKEIIKQNNELEIHRNQLEDLVKKRTFELSIAKDKAEESNRLKAAFMENISHEIRTPMNGIIGFIDLLKSPEFDKEQQDEFLVIIENCSRQLMAIITDIVEISKLESTHVKPIIKPCILTDVRDNIVSMFHQTFSKNPNVEFKLNCKVEDIVCLTDEVKLKQILTNLISNAIKNTPSGFIELGCSVIENEKIVYYVKDSGIGISKENQLLIFERFMQVDNTLTRQNGGTGLGLAITKAYIELLNGEIWLESSPGIGSTFFFSIPYNGLTDESKPKQDKKEEKSNKQDFEGITILIAEDTDINYQFLEIALKRNKFNILRAVNGKEAVDMCKTNQNIDIVLMDIKMPVLNGHDATKQILEFRSSLPIIAQTAYAFSDDKIKAFESGCIDYITKPLKVKQLLELIKKHLKLEFDIV